MTIYTPKDLFKAIKKNDREKVKNILMTGSAERKILLLAKHNNATPIAYAALNGFWAIVKMIAGYRTDFEDNCRYSEALLLAAEKNQPDVVIDLLAAGAMQKWCINDNGEHQGFAPIHFAVLHNNLSLIRLLCRNNIDCLAMKVNGDTPIVFAAKKGYWGAVRIIASHPTNANDEYGYSDALLFAAEAKQTDVVVDLLIAGANQGKVVAASVPSISRYGAIHFAAALGDVASVKALCQNNSDCSLFRTGDNKTPMALAVRENEWDVIETLVMYGVNDDDDLGPALLLAAANNKTKVVARLLDANAPPYSHCTSGTFMGYFPICFASYFGDAHAVKTLGERYPKFLARYTMEFDPLVIAAKSKHWNVVEVVLELALVNKIDLSRHIEFCRQINQDTAIKIDALLKKIEDKLTWVEQSDLIKVLMNVLKPLITIDGEEAIQNELICPITLELFKNPVEAIPADNAIKNGNIYEEKAIRKNLQNSMNDPITRFPLSGELVISLEKQVHVIVYLRTKLIQLICNPQSLGSLVNNHLVSFKFVNQHVIINQNESVLLQSNNEALKLNIHQYIQFQTFKKAYCDKFSSTFFKNPFSKMNQLLITGQVQTIEQVEAYAKEDPDSRTAEIWREMNPVRPH